MALAGALWLDSFVDGPSRWPGATCIGRAASQGLAAQPTASHCAPSGRTEAGVAGKVPAVLPALPEWRFDAAPERLTDPADQ